MTISVKDSPISKLVMFSPQVSIWSGTLKIDRELDLKTIADTLPPQDVASDGRKNLVDQKFLGAPRALRKRLERLLKTSGFSLIGDCIAVNEERAASVLQELPKLEAEFAIAVDDLIDKLDEAYQKQVDRAPPEWKTLLVQGRLTADEVRKRFAFKVGVFKIAAPSDDVNDPMTAHYANTIMVTATPRLMEDIAAEAREMLLTQFMTPVDPSAPKGRRRFKETIPQATVKSVARLIDKMSDYSFLDVRVHPTVCSLRMILTGLPATGSLNAQDTNTCSTILRQLMDPESILGIGEAFAANPGVVVAPPAQAGLFPQTAPPQQPSTQPTSPSAGARLGAPKGLSGARRKVFATQ
ncbi:hypothetical protein H8Z72_23325 (plasmid) [Xanthomonas citri pv. citri]|uniref:DUF3150 domain-containing protein n=1 Tax=Xanthomonas citri TaxID=346 RepID=UPI001931CD70|nr:DUF3150 domain-containing protein [Xanthomonas citri]QRD62754.1 hypothetical protein H8Z74_22860 [Xanthomonas citri pv. citri]QRD67081.1 hypothetical protein H8Z73_22945 [Xanthomonas citri pv. citri]QRD71666.1 hypothetical protein H8Z72_23325 [Xanthomonas citri pv. citri]